ncbi:response regulator [Paracoccus sp. S-4012]|uniref:response regulator transcription factor n=1 Tax=Paracoccus sp. S-4012 TaxID=2665648 RepID=UPI0012B132F5|nr:response regulator [Paracoccus sp. S-4012]MRX50046.1 response regulator [Paracoccus sp. S-4012]
MPDILIAEDEPTIMETLKFLLELEGWSVCGVTTGDAVLREMRRRPPGMVILDVMLPGMSGLDVLGKLRADPDHARVPVLILTARGQSHDRQLAMDLKADGFVTKPFANDDVVSEVRRLLASQPIGTMER